jgi:hypothetical protein
VVSTQLCKRVACGKEAEAVLLMVPQECQAWLVSTDHTAASEGSPLCQEHADRTTVPVGWMLSDDRTSSKKKRRKGIKQTKGRKQAKGGKAQTTSSPRQPSLPEPDLISIVDEIPIQDAPLPGDVEDVKELVSEPFEDSYLQVVSEDELLESDTEGLVQGALWGDIETAGKIDPGDETPLLRRAFRVVSDE